MLLEIDRLSVSYRDESGTVTSAARGVDLRLDRGEILGLVGESGSGKSSVSMSVARLLPSPPAFYPEGRILLDGEDVLAMPLGRLREIRGRKVGVIFQDPMGSLSPLWRIGSQMMETVLLHERVSRAAARALALEWLGKVQLADPATVFNAWPHELSGGMQQRVMIAMAMMLGPDLVIADEPTTALDVTVQAEILKLMKSLISRDSGVLLISHDLGVVANMATRLAVMRKGEIVERSDDVGAFFAAPAHPYSQALVREARRMSV